MSADAAVPVTVALGVVAVLLLLTAAAVTALGGFGRWWSIVGAAARGAAQLLIVSVAISQIVVSHIATAAFIVLMLLIAVRTAGARITSNRTWWWAAAAITGGVAPAVALFLASGAIPATGLVLIPLVGQLIGGALTATSIAGRNLLDELTTRHGEFEAGLALGLSAREARLEIARPVAGAALFPALDQTRTVGMVTLPGAFVGMLLGGASPIEAGAVQMFVLIGLLAVESVAILITLHLVAAGRLDRPHNAPRPTAARPARWRLRPRRPRKPRRPRRPGRPPE